MVEESRLARWMAASLGLHLLLLALLPGLRQLPATPPALLEVDLASLPPPAPRLRPAPAPPAVVPVPAVPLPSQQIVSPSDAGEERAPVETRLLSDRDNAVQEMQVKRGDGGPVANEDRSAETERDPPAREKPAEAKPPARPVVARRPEPAQPAQVRPPADAKPLPRLSDLLPGEGDLAALARSEPSIPPPDSEVRRPESPRRLQLDGGGRVAFSSRPGINDFLPAIREGDITLLNTKAERFAPFVRRVAARVFQHLDMRLRQTARSGAMSAGREFAVVEAIMSRDGQLVHARVRQRESTTSIGADRLLLSVTEPDTFFDSNPPPGAEAEDGQIHFLLLIDLQVQAANDPRSGRTVFGYHGIAGVGLDVAPERRGGG